MFAANNQNFSPMHILIIFATPAEAAALGTLSPPEAVSGLYFPVGSHTAELLLCGVGMVQAAITTASRLAGHRPDLVIHGGISGSYLASPAIGEAVMIASECFPETGKQAGNRFITLDQMGFGFLNLPFNNNTLQNPFNPGRFKTNLPLVGGATVNQITVSRERSEAIHRQFGAHTESMEGGAVLAACLATKVDCIQVRAISNYCLPPPDDHWHLKTAIEQLGIAVVGVLKSYI